jgi:hypothetical protein
MASQKKYLTAFMLQNGSNMSGLLYEFNRQLTEILEVDAPIVRGTGYHMNQWFGQHPIMVMWFSKFMDLGRMWNSNVSDIAYGNAYKIMKVIEEYPNCEVCPGCHQPVDAIFATMKTCVICEKWELPKKAEVA